MSRSVTELADDFVLGLLEGADAETVAARIAAPANAEDRDLAAAVGAAQDRFLALDLTAPELAPAADLWQRIEASLAAPAPAARAAGPATPRAANLPNAPGAGRWRLAAIGSMAAAALLAVGLGWRTLFAPDPAVVAVLLDQGGEPVAVVEAFEDNRVFVTALRESGAGPGETMQLWTKPDPDGPPISVGILDEAARMAVRNPPDMPAPDAGQLYEITIEDAGGSPTGLPTGPVFGLGNAARPAE